MYGISDELIVNKINVFINNSDFFDFNKSQRLISINTKSLFNVLIPRY